MAGPISLFSSFHFLMVVRYMSVYHQMYITIEYHVHFQHQRVVSRVESHSFSVA
jgi:hypothetical protein